MSEYTLEDFKLGDVITVDGVSKYVMSYHDPGVGSFICVSITDLDIPFIPGIVGVVPLADVLASGLEVKKICQ